MRRLTQALIIADVISVTAFSAWLFTTRSGSRWDESMRFGQRDDYAARLRGFKKQSTSRAGSIRIGNARTYR